MGRGRAAGRGNRTSVARRRQHGGGTTDTYQRLVDEAQHEDVVQEDVSGVPPAEADVGDGRVPLQPQLVQAVLQQRPTPRRELLLHQRVLKDLQHTTASTRAPPAPAASSVLYLLVGVHGHQVSAAGVDGDGGGAGPMRGEGAVEL